MTIQQTKRNHIAEGKASYQRWADSLVADEEGQRLYEEETARKELWLQLVEARHAAGLTQAQLADRLGVSQSQVARIERRGHDAYTLNSLRRYVNALGKDFKLEVRVQHEPHTVVTR